MRRRNLLGGKGFHYVDLGLPSGIKWASQNLSAETESDVGAYYSWGNIIGHMPSEGYNFNSSNYNSTSGKSLSTNIPRNATYDAAYAKEGQNWTIPTIDDINELKNNCTITNYTNTNNDYGVAGKLFTSNINGEKIFFPNSGYYSSTSKTSTNYIYMWAKNYTDSSYSCAAYVNTTSLSTTSYQYRHYGLPIRPVYSPIVLGLALSKYTGSSGPWESSTSIEVYYDSSIVLDSSVTVTKSGCISSASFNSSTGKVSIYWGSNTSTSNSRTGTVTVTYKGESKTWTLTQSQDSLERGDVYIYKVNDISRFTGQLINTNNSMYTGTITPNSHGTYDYPPSYNPSAGWGTQSFYYTNGNNSSDYGKSYDITCFLEVTKKCIDKYRSGRIVLKSTTTETIKLGENFDNMDDNGNYIAIVHEFRFSYNLTDKKIGIHTAGGITFEGNEYLGWGDEYDYTWDIDYINNGYYYWPQYFDNVSLPLTFYTESKWYDKTLRVTLKSVTENSTYSGRYDYVLGYYLG